MQYRAVRAKLGEQDGPLDGPLAEAQARLRNGERWRSLPAIFEPAGDDVRYATGPGRAEADGEVAGPCEVGGGRTRGGASGEGSAGSGEPDGATYGDVEMWAKLRAVVVPEVR